jgi:hypothetical protein
LITQSARQVKGTQLERASEELVLSRYIPLLLMIFTLIHLGSSLYTHVLLASLGRRCYRRIRKLLGVVSVNECYVLVWTWKLFVCVPQILPNNPDCYDSILSSSQR